MKTIAIMQPYFFPYLGYFQLLNAVDDFIFLDDVHFIKKGFIHRNSILMNRKASLFSIPLQNLSQNRLICDHQLFEFEKTKRKFLLTLQQAYSKAPKYSSVMPLIQSIFEKKHETIVALIHASMLSVCQFLDIQTTMHHSSQIAYDKKCTGSARILNLCEFFNAKKYINLSGGMDLYCADDFQCRGITLAFLKMKPISYPQFDPIFVPSLSMIDVLMFNSKVQIQKFLSAYDLFFPSGR